MSEEESIGWAERPDGWEKVNYEYVHDVLHMPDPNPNPDPDTDTVGESHIKETRESDMMNWCPDAIFVLAGGLNHENRNHQWVVRRLDLAEKLWSQYQHSSPELEILCLGGGTYHKPSPRNNQGFVMHESTVCAQYLISRGVPHDRIMREWSSYDTIANAWFALTNYAIPFDYRQITIITSDFHMPRTRAIFMWLWDIAGRSPDKELRFYAVSSDGLDSSIINARKEREAKSLRTLLCTVKRINDLKQFAGWFYHEHRAYNCEDSLVRTPDMQGGLVHKSY